MRCRTQFIYNLNFYLLKKLLSLVVLSLNAVKGFFYLRNYFMTFFLLKLFTIYCPQEHCSSPIWQKIRVQAALHMLNFQSMSTGKSKLKCLLDHFMPLQTDIQVLITSGKWHTMKFKNRGKLRFSPSVCSHWLSLRSIDLFKAMQAQLKFCYRRFVSIGNVQRKIHRVLQFYVFWLSPSQTPPAPGGDKGKENV